MRVQLNFKSGVPVYLQIVEQVKAAVAAGSLRPDEALPSVRVLAEELRVNRNTVARAYGELAVQGVVSNEAGRGCFIRDHGQPLRKDARRAMLTQPVDALLVQAHHLRIPPDELLALIQERLRLLEQQKEKDTES
ncbi:MAG: GntR family transcriptional regulator [Verrucomicrobiae bacterium]|nr:GntR family transcriptional regulator [Verrucomicrobiae bacterium]